MKDEILDAMDAAVMLFNSWVDFPDSVHEDIDEHIYQAVIKWVGQDEEEEIRALDWDDLREFVENCDEN